MNRYNTPHPIPDWIQSPMTPAQPAPGYDAWLEADLAAGTADIDSGNTIPLAQLRNDLGLE